MEILLDHKELINLIKEISPYSTLFDNILVKSVGQYTGGFNGKWIWNEYALKGLTKLELYKLYNMCKESWI